VSYGKGALFNSIVTKARQRVVGHYGLDGNMDSIIEKVEWLLNASHFIYGELNLKVQKFFLISTVNNLFFYSGKDV
jgi:hypothetical protein